MQDYNAEEKDTMTEKLFTVHPRQWLGWQEMPPSHPCWGASPIFVTDVKPLKTGKGILRVEFVHVLHPVAATRRSESMRVIYRAPSHLIGEFTDDEGQLRTAVVSIADFDWIRSFCQLFWERRPPEAPDLLINGARLPGPTAKEHLAAAFGDREEEVLSGATSRSFASDQGLPEMPRCCASISLGQSFDPFDSWLIARGCVPKAMEDKWFVYLDNGRLIFRRSWTGVLIYDVEAHWEARALCLGAAKVNRDPDEYAETDDEIDRRLLLSIIDGLLLRRPMNHSF